MTTINPYQSPAEVPSIPQHTPEQTRIIRNIRAICILYILFGSIAVLAGIGMLSDGNGVPPAIACLVFAMGLAGIISAIGVLRRRTWGVLFCQIVSALYLLSFPVGTILGGYFLLNIGKVKDDFRRETPPSP